MLSRRRLIRALLACVTAAGIGASALGGLAAAAWARAGRRLVPRGAPMSSLILADPAELDTSALETTPLEEFDVMGQTDQPVDLAGWRLEISGAVRKPATYTYDELLARPAIERHALLICPGFFAYNGWWKGVSVAGLLEEAGLDPGATRVKFSGPEGVRKQSRRFPLDQVLSDQLFLAYRVNGEPLPERHGFPLRLVAEGHKGRFWVKYVTGVTVMD